MKLNELKQPTKEAIDLSPLVGHYGQSFIGDKSAGQDREGAMAKNIFVRNFMQKAISGLDSGINSGLVDVNAVGGAQAQPAAAAQPQTAQPQTPAQVRQQKQAVAAKTAQAGMTPKPAAAPVAKRLTPAQIRQQKQAIAAKAADASQSIAAKASAPIAPTPDQIRQQKQAAAAQAAQAGMTPKPVTKPAVWRSGRNPSARATTRENKAFTKLNNIFEGILNVNEATGQSISQYIQGLFMQYMKGVPMNDPNTVQQLKTLADEVQATYAKDKGKAALTKMADLGWAASHSPEATQQQTAAGQQPASAGQPASASQQSAQGQPAQQSNPAADQKSIVGVKQINKIIPTLRKRDLLSVKKNIDNTLAGRGGSTTAAPAAAPAAGNSAFGQMASQLKGSANSKSSTGGTTTKTPTGLVHTAAKSKVPAQQAATPPATDNVVKMPKGKVRAAKEGGVTPEEQAKFDQRVQQAMASQKE